MTCYNRRDTTLACLDALRRQEGIEDIDLKVYLVDDGCTDATGDAVHKQFPDVKVLEGDGNLYWCGGMRMAFGEAMKKDYDHYVWLNDDTHLYPNAVSLLLDTARKVSEIDGRDGIIVGAICDPETGRHTYGGVVRISKRHPLGFQLVEPGDEPLRCDTMNGNCVLIPRSVAQVVGNMSPEFTHWIGDTDYCLRARSKGISSWVTPGYVGTCRSNTDGCRWADPSLSLRERLKLLYSPKGLPPREWVVFARRHGHSIWPWLWLKLHLRVFLPKIWVWCGKEFEPSEKISPKSCHEDGSHDADIDRGH